MDISQRTLDFALLMNATFGSTVSQNTSQGYAELGTLTNQDGI